MIAFAVVLVWPLASPAGVGAGPLECADLHVRNSPRDNVWERLKSPELQRFCDLVASASSKLAGPATMADAALAATRHAEAILPDRASARAMEGRALAALGRPDEALAALLDASNRDARILLDPATLHAFARVLARTGGADRAAQAYRALLPRAAALPLSERAAASTEAGLLGLTLGPDALDDAAGALRDAMRLSQEGAAKVAALGLALALDRRGDVEGARALLVSRGQGDPRSLLATGTARELLAVAPLETPALLAIGLEAIDPAAARSEWHDYRVEAERRGGPWTAHARLHEAPLAGARPPPLRSGR